jgi:hypothetical protein
MFSEVERDAACRGGCEGDGGIGDYLEAQGAPPFMEAADRYLQLFMKLYMMTYDKPEEREALASVIQSISGGGESGNSILMDVDGTVEAYCREAGMPFPGGIEEKMAVHILAVEAWAKTMTKRGSL